MTKIFEGAPEKPQVAPILGQTADVFNPAKAENISFNREFADYMGGLADKNVVVYEESDGPPDYTYTTNGAIHFDRLAEVYYEFSNNSWRNRQTGGVLQRSALLNRVINGAMNVNQRKSVVTVGEGGLVGYSVDRFGGLRDGSGLAFRLEQSTDAPATFTNSLKATSTAGGAVVDGMVSSIVHPIEGLNMVGSGFGTIDAQKLSVQFWVKTSVAGDFPFMMANAARDRVYGKLFTVNAADTWQRIMFTIDGDQAGTWLFDTDVGIYVYWGLGAAGDSRTVTADTWSAAHTAGAILGTVAGATSLLDVSGATMHLTGVQIEVADAPSAFQHKARGVELSECQRYYHEGEYRGTFSFYATNTSLVHVSLPVAMRAAPSAAATLVEIRGANGGTVASNGVGINRSMPGNVTFTPMAASGVPHNSVGLGLITYSLDAEL